MNGDIGLANGGEPSSPVRSLRQKPAERDAGSGSEQSDADDSSASGSASSDDEELDDDDGGEYIGTSRVRSSIVPERADITPYGRSKRRSAAAASSAWRKLGPRKSQPQEHLPTPEVVIDVPVKRGRGRPKGSLNKKTLALMKARAEGRITSAEPSPAGSTSADPTATTPRKRGRPKGSKNKKPSTPRKQAPQTPTRISRALSESDGDSEDSSDSDDDLEGLAVVSDDDADAADFSLAVMPTKYRLVPESPRKTPLPAQFTAAAVPQTPASDVSTPRKRGRPRKYPLPEGAQTTPSKPIPDANGVITPRKRGRPPKTPTKDAEQSVLENLKGKARATEAELALDRLNGQGSRLIKPTSSDAYFVHHAPQKAAKKQTSDTAISDRLPRISSRAVASLTRQIARELQSSARSGNQTKTYSSTGIDAFLPVTHFEPYFDEWYSLMQATNRPLLCYGVGSKRAPLQSFARHLARRGECTAIVVRCEAGGRVEEIIGELERMLAISPATDISKAKRAAYATALDARVDHITQKLSQDDGPCILLVVHNVDTSTMVQERSLHLLGLLCLSERIHLIADTSHVNAGMLSSAVAAHTDGREMLPWLWIDVTTFVPMLDEMLGERGAGTARQLGLPAALDIRTVGGTTDVDVLAYDVGAAGERARRGEQVDEGGSSVARNLSDRAAVHILRSVTFKARGLFLLLAGRLLQQQQGSTDTTNTTRTQTTYDELSQLARNNFLAMTPDALRSLLVEFTSHGLIYVGGLDDTSATSELGSQSQQQYGNTALPEGEAARSGIVHIALSRNDLARVVEEFKAKG